MIHFDAVHFAQQHFGMRHFGEGGPVVVVSGYYPPHARYRDPNAVERYLDGNAVERYRDPNKTQRGGL